MGNTGLLRREAKMTHLQPKLGETRHPRTQELALLALLFVHVSASKGGRRLLQETPLWGQLLSKQLLIVGRGKPNFRGSRGCFRPHSRGRGRGKPSPPQ